MLDLKFNPMNSIVPIEEASQELAEDMLNKKILRHQFKNKRLTYEDYQMYWQEQNRPFSAQDDNLLVRKAGK